MAVEKIEKRHIKKTGKPYYWNSKILPKKNRADIYALYNFVHTTRDLVLHDPKSIKMLKVAYEKALEDSSFDQIAHSWDEQTERALKHIVRLVHKYKFEPIWIHNFLNTHAIDAEKNGYANYEALLKYLEGAVDTVGLMTAKILRLSDDLQKAAVAQSRAVAWVSIVRRACIDHDHGLVYFPRNELRAYTLKDASRTTAKNQSYDFRRFIRFELKRYYSWQSETDKMLTGLPEEFVEAQNALSWIHLSIAEKIKDEPLVIIDKQVRPHALRFVWEDTKRVAHKTAKILAAQEKPATKK